MTIVLERQSSTLSPIFTTKAPAESAMSAALPFPFSVARTKVKLHLQNKNTAVRKSRENLSSRFVWTRSHLITVLVIRDARVRSFFPFQLSAVGVTQPAISILMPARGVENVF